MNRRRSKFFGKLITLFVLIFMSAVVLFVIFGPYGFETRIYLAMAACVIVGIPAGIILGSQEKYYF